MTPQKITYAIYDTLMGNFDYEQFDLEAVTNQEVDVKKGLITFEYNSRKIKVEISEVK